MKKFLLFLLVAGVYVLHQDNWNWTSAGVFFDAFPVWLKSSLDFLLFINPNNGLIFGFLPAGLAYHAGYSILAAILMAVLVKFAWPEHLEQSEPHESHPDKQNGEKRG